MHELTGFESRGESIFTGDLMYGPTQADESRHPRLAQTQQVCYQGQ